MSAPTIASSPSRAELAKGEQRFLLRAVNWDFYETMLKALGDRHIFLTYDRGNIEFMSPSLPHERYAHKVGRLVEIAATELKRRFMSCGSTTFRRRDMDRGLESDKCYYFQNALKVIDKSEVDLTHDPPPDLAIEIDITSSSLDRQGIYAQLGVPEIWCFDGETLRFYRLCPDGKYQTVEQSPTLPLLTPAEVVILLEQSAGIDDMEMELLFRTWVRERISISGDQG